MRKLRTKVRLSQQGKCRTYVSGAILAMLATASAVAADSAPKLDVGQSCEAAARGSVVAGRNKEACLADERVSQDQITKNWSQYAAADKTLCVGMNMTGGPASYVELLSCLEIMRDAKTIRKDELADPLLNKNGQIDTRTLEPTDLHEGDLHGGGDAKTYRVHKRQHRE
jgi:hypothetical protein